LARSSEVLIIGAGPAGIASAIAARIKGLEVSVADVRRPPIDKACGEGLLPEGVASLCRLGVRFTSDVSHPFLGLRFRDNQKSAAAYFPGSPALGVRRTILHNLLLSRAESLGVRFFWGARLTQLAEGSARLNSQVVQFRWLVGADGFNSQVRKLAGLSSFQWYKTSRLGFRRHFEVAPWSDMAEVFWGDGYQIVVTPTADDEVCVSMFTSRLRIRLAQAIASFPDLASRLRGRSPKDGELGSITSLRNSHVASRGRIALVGDASCTVDGIAGQGLTLAFLEAISLAESLSRSDLASYAAEHHRITQNARRMTGLLLLMSRSRWIRRRIFRLFSSRPEVFSRMTALHSGPPSVHHLGIREVFYLTLEMLGA
jgi:menaquinone-9 beta-reductase